MTWNLSDARARDAATEYDEEGLLPTEIDRRELLALVDRMAGALRTYIEWCDAGDSRSVPFIHRMQMCANAEDAARAALQETQR